MYGVSGDAFLNLKHAGKGLCMHGVLSFGLRLRVIDLLWALLLRRLWIF
jgi:hypothetical protein